MGDSFVVHEAKCDVGLLAPLLKDLSDAMQQLTGAAAADEEISKQRKIQAIEVKELGRAFRIGNKKPVVRMSCTMKLMTDTTELGFLLAKLRVDSKRSVGDNSRTLKGFEILESRLDLASVGFKLGAPSAKRVHRPDR